MRLLVAALLLCYALPSPAAEAEVRAVSLAKATSAEIERETARLSTLPAGWERVRAASEGFLGAPYRNSPLGEGTGVDPDPRLRWDAVDCITLIETAMAVAEARSLAEVRPILDDIRYADGKAPSFENRLHLMEAQWIPDLIRKGYLEDVTARVGGERVVEAELSYSKQIWSKRSHLRGHPWSDSLEGAHALPMIPLEAAIDLASTFPEGLVLNVVRAPVPGKMNLITHSGLVVIKDGERFVRHAALREKVVIDEPLDRFLRRHSQMRLRKVVGVNLLAIRSNPERVRQVLATQSIVDSGE